MDKIENFKWKKEYLYIIVLMLFLSIGLLLWCCFKNNKVEEVEPELVLEKEISPKTRDKIKVDIKGQVIKPGVYEMELGQTIDDQTTPIMIQRLNNIFQRNPLISIGI